jgi:hypothetical protein
MIKRDPAAWNAWRGKYDGMLFNLRGADLSGAYLAGANFRFVFLLGVNFRGADLRFATLSHAMLAYADFSNALIGFTDFGDVDLSHVKGLDTVKHNGPSTIGIDTIYRSGGKIPGIFLRGAGVPDNFISDMARL